MRTEYVQTMRSFRNNGGDIAGLLAQVDNGGALIGLVQELALPACRQGLITAEPRKHQIAARTLYQPKPATMTPPRLASPSSMKA